MYSVSYSECAFVLLVISGLYVYHRRNTPRLPPGPRGLPLVGNVLNMPLVRAWETFSKWGEQYGPISSATVFGQTFVILNDYEMAHDLLHKQGTLYADRATLEMAHISGWDRTLGPSRYGPQMREYRKLMARVIGSKNSLMKLYPIEEYQSNLFLKRILETPDDPASGCRKTAGALVLQVTYGYNILEDRPDPLVDLADQAIKEFSEITAPGAFLVETLPILKYVPSWFPGAGFKLFAEDCRRRSEDLSDIPFDFVKGKMADGTATKSYVADLLSRGDLGADTVHNIKWSAATFYGAGADTTAIVLTYYFLAIAMHPDVQEKAWTEMNAVVGKDRLPTFTDRDSLPYIEAICKELFRWMPIVPLGIPHRAMEDNVYAGYFIPKDTLVIANVWSFLHNPSVYKDPYVFNPDRFMGPNAERNPQDAVFGFGRRICPGNHLADLSVWINVAKAVAALDVSKVVDEAGKPVEPVADVEGLVITRPLPFACAVKPRSERIPIIIQEALSKVNVVRDEVQV